MPYVFRQGDLPKLDVQVDRGADFMAWKSQWESYMSLSGLSEESAEKKVQALTLCFSRETLSIVHNLGLSDADKRDITAIIAAIKAYIDGHINESVERRNFRRRTQQPGETFDDFLLTLRELVKTCNFCTNDCMQKNIRDQIIEGILDGDTVEDLLQIKDLTLDKAIQVCQAQEAAKKQRANMIGIHHESVAAIRNAPRKKPPSHTALGYSATCPGCGSRLHQGGRARCPAFGLPCNNCGKLGHFAKVCRSRPSLPEPKATLTASTNTVSTNQDLLLSNISNVAASDPAPKIVVNITTRNGTTSIAVLPDSGADVSAAGEAVLHHLNEHIDNLLPSHIIPKAANGTEMHPMGKLPVHLKLGNKEFADELHIYPDVCGMLISWKACKSLGILPDCYPHPLVATAVTQTQPLDPPSISTTHVSTTSSLTKDSVVAEFPMVFDGIVRAMDGEQFHIHLSANAKPFCVTSPRSIPFAYRDKLAAELALLQQQQIIAPVTEPTDWCAPIVVTPKKNSDSIRMCVDLSHLNRFVKRERYQSSSPAEAVADMAASNAKFFTILDAKKGYHQCPLDPQSQSLTTFITPFGRFKYLRAPYGISSISEHYDRRMAEAFSGLTGFRRIVDDIVIYDSDATQHANHVRAFLQRCAEKQIALNLDKCHFSQTQATFAGFQLSSNGYQVDGSITEAISSFPTPTNRTDLRSFFGLVNQLSASTNTISSLLAPLRSLLSTKNDFVWSPTHDQAFQAAKEHLTIAPTLSFFDIDKPTRLSTDASRHGLGFILQQQTPDGKWTLTQAGSRFLSDAECRYAIIELEMLAVCWAILKCHMFLAGLQHFQVITDHNPLIPILNNHRLDEIENPRLQRLRTRIMGYNFTAEWLKGSNNSAPDALSRNPVSDPSPHDILAELDILNQPEISISEIRATSATNHISPHLDTLRKTTKEDPEYQQLLQFILDGFPNHRSQLPDSCKRYWTARDHLTIDDDLIVHGCRLLIPVKMRPQVLTQLHESHQGSVRTKQRARLSVYWPGIDNDIDNIILACQQCQDHLPSNPKEPITQKPKPDRPFQEIAIDLCSHAGRTYLIIVDCFTDWPAIISLDHGTTSAHVITAIRQSFCRTAIPDIVWSDGGPQFTSKLFTDFANRWGFLHKVSSPRYPQSNGKVEATVKSMKKLIYASWTGRSLDHDKLCRALLQYRNTPSRKDGLSPSHKLFGHPVQDTLPAHHRSFLPEWQRPIATAEQQRQDTLQSSAAFYNSHAHTLSDINVGSHVAIQNPQTKIWDIYGTVTEISPQRRYYIKTKGGRVLVRNRRFLRRRVPTSIPTDISQAGSNQPPTQQSSTLRRSSRDKRSTRRLIEDPNWN